MMSRLARITWLTPEEGGRDAPPSGPRYVAPTRFKNQAPGSEGANWSFVVDLIKHMTGSADWLADVHYLADEAPHELLRMCARFELYEGKKCVAHGIIITPAADELNRSDARPIVEQADTKP